MVWLSLRLVVAASCLRSFSERGARGHVGRIEPLLEREGIGSGTVIGEKLENNSTAAVILFENLWAIQFVKAVENANGRSVMHIRIPHEDVVEMMEKITSEEAKLEAGKQTEAKPETAS